VEGRRYGEEQAMTLLDTLALVIAAALLVYLFFALLNPEKFQ
jgi:K+-transporting ATPase KdpF subunit